MWRERGRNKGGAGGGVAKQQSSVEGGIKKHVGSGKLTKKTPHTIKRYPSEEQRAANRGEEHVDHALSVRSSNKPARLHGSTKVMDEPVCGWTTGTWREG